MIGAFLIGLVLITTVLMVPQLAGIFKVQTCSLVQMMMIYGFALIDLIIIQAYKFLKYKN